ncbi:hypothetical protein AtubIFM56815_002132 [Aspergillus tubingensis]|uniref:Cytochrome P450 monooxygenase otaC n=1 Tax=Aspergillus tubingensis TaxID=5068 RepID=A0A9W6EPS1_ASPTU|nr:hypothetical protein AtubIFM56815_002132 [Aspergillus tubingensis]
MNLLALTVTGCLLYITGLVVYRLWWSPLAPFPGPKLAAATGWYEAYFELIKKGGGQFTFHIRELHDKYGPIVRISPTELHIHDSEYYETLYTSQRGLDKSPHVQNRFGSPLASFSTPEHNLHKRRRAAIVPFFSKRRTYEQAPMIQSHVDRITHRLATEYAGTDRIVCTNDLFSSYGADVIMTYAFNRSYNFLSRPDFTSAFTRAIQGLKDFVHIAQQFPIIGALAQSLPPSVVGLINPDMKAIARFKEEISEHVRQVRDNHMRGRHDLNQRGTVFFEMLHSAELANRVEETSFPRLRDEGVGIVGAGIETTKMANLVTVYHILANPPILARLQAELTAAMPDPAQPLPLNELERLPYLSACIQEGIRLSYGVTMRSQRIARDGPIQYKNWTIPPHVMVSMDTYHTHNDEAIFPDSTSYRPERWLGNPRGPDGQKSLTRYLTAFGRGTRMCIGFNLAYALMTIMLAGLFRRLDFELYETTRRDVDCYRDMVGMDVAPGSKGVRLQVKGVRE